MARPCRQRNVASALSGGVYAPREVAPEDRKALDGAGELTLDGLEALRLVDLEGLYQEAAAEEMGVSRATLARVLTRARRSVAEALVYKRVLVIGGGVVRRGSEKPRPCPVHGGRRRRGRGCRCGGGRGRGRGFANPEGTGSARTGPDVRSGSRAPREE